MKIVNCRGSGISDNEGQGFVQYGNGDVVHIPVTARKVDNAPLEPFQKGTDRIASRDFVLGIIFDVPGIAVIPQLFGVLVIKAVSDRSSVLVQKIPRPPVSVHKGIAVVLETLPGIGGIIFVVIDAQGFIRGVGIDLRGNVDGRVLGHGYGLGIFREFPVKVFQLEDHRIGGIVVIRQGIVVLQNVFEVDGGAGIGEPAKSRGAF